MLSIASREGPSDEEIIREVEHLTQQIIPELLRRFDGRSTDEEVEERGTDEDWEDLATEFEVSSASNALIELRKAKSHIENLNAQIATLESELSFIS